MHQSLIAQLASPVYITLVIFLTVVTALGLPRNQSVGQQAGSLSLRLPPRPPAEEAPQEYNVIPVNAAAVAYIGDVITAQAVEGSIRTITSPTRREFNYVLYWNFLATGHAARILPIYLREDVTYPDSILAGRR